VRALSAGAAATSRTRVRSAIGGAPPPAASPPTHLSFCSAAAPRATDSAHPTHVTSTPATATPSGQPTTGKASGGAAQHQAGMAAVVDKMLDEQLKAHAERLHPELKQQQVASGSGPVGTHAAADSGPHSARAAVLADPLPKARPSLTTAATATQAAAQAGTGPKPKVQFIGDAASAPDQGLPTAASLPLAAAAAAAATGPAATGAAAAAAAAGSSNPLGEDPRKIDVSRRRPARRRAPAPHTWAPPGAPGGRQQLLPPSGCCRCSSSPRCRAGGAAQPPGQPAQRSCHAPPCPLASPCPPAPCPPCSRRSGPSRRR
jgi:hypothetical protein